MGHCPTKAAEVGGTEQDLEDRVSDLLERGGDSPVGLRIEGNLNILDSSKSLVAKSTTQKKNYAPIIAGISVGSIVFIGIIIIIFWRLKRKESISPPEEGEEISREDAPLQGTRKVNNLESKRNHFSFQEISKITRKFERMIGRGGFGIVYYGSLDDGMEVAVKMISRNSQGAKEFQAEAQILTRVHHRNLVSLLGYCDDKNNLALVYEYMQKGSLSDHLSGGGDDAITQNWAVRLKIALDVAQGLNYLHSFCKPSVIHRDIKTRNILLNQNYEAKLGDFGLSKLFSFDDATHISTKVAGTPGYLDPEYHQTYRLTEKSDVYSFGIVLWEIVTGLPPTSTDPQGGPILPWVRSRLERGDISCIVDQRLAGKYDLNSMWKVVEIAMACSSSTSSDRPKMSEVSRQLKECLEFIGSRDDSRSFKSQISSADAMFPVEFNISANPSER